MLNVLKSKPIHVCFFGDADQKHVTKFSSPLCSKCLPFMDIRLNSKRKNTFLRLLTGSYVDWKHALCSRFNISRTSFCYLGSFTELWHEAGYQPKIIYYKLHLKELACDEWSEWKAVVKQTEAPAIRPWRPVSKVQQPPPTSHSNFHSQRDWCWEYRFSPSDRWLSWMPDRSLGLCDGCLG